MFIRCSVLSVAAIAFCLFVAENAPAHADSNEVSAVVSKSAYAFEYFPPCGTRINAMELSANVAAIATVFGSPYGGAIVAGGALWDEVRQHGGFISNMFSKIEGGSKSSCVALCVKTQGGERIRHAEFLIDGQHCGAAPSGGGPVENEWYPGESMNKLECGKGYGGWETMAVGDEAACGTAANWKHDWTRSVQIWIHY